MPYVVTSPISHLGRTYAAGEAIELDPGAAYQLVAAGCVKEAPPPVPIQHSAPSTLRGPAPAVDKKG
jgi:hypothetical protein